ncbi:sigma-E factor negative regulatory protein [Granulosicoccus antarcticus]|uniref:Sigma factor AlgU negative regulatory protein n=1 Tax=Granulosicoccus antarcticus IMCC3135 TaxID=1192854 RepID=A0A2Z2NSH9_9GAMM|nr:sigma-E factor negative regulatory protein [Granulosicoccus antarcticus]ASJ74462.1 Sigma factor AlgU negative regulatory protein [Granulosicoccus antarcticus IMCC3135]
MQHPNDPVNNEQLSQLMDGEWHELNPSECVKGVCGDEALRAKWARYHLIRDVINNEPVQTDSALVSRICAAIDDEPAYSNITPISSEAASLASPSSNVTVEQAAPVADLSAAREQRSSWLGTGITGFALAASVAAVTVVGMNVWQQDPAQPTQTLASSGASSIDGSNAFSQQVLGTPLPEVDLVANTGSFWVSPQSSERVGDEERLNMLLSQHIENSPTSDREGLLPYSRLVGYDERTQER